MNRHQKSLNYALSVLQSEKYAGVVREAYLFGSCARNNYSYNSDVDLFLFLKKGTPQSMLCELKTDVTPDDYDLPEVDVKFSYGEQFSSIYQFEQNLRREAKLLWKNC